VPLSPNYNSRNAARAVGAGFVNGKANGWHTKGECLQLYACKVSAVVVPHKRPNLDFLLLSESFFMFLSICLYVRNAKSGQKNGRLSEQ
jgi:hypothetical protein